MSFTRRFSVLHFLLFLLFLHLRRLSDFFSSPHCFPSPNCWIGVPYAPLQCSAQNIGTNPTQYKRSTKIMEKGKPKTISSNMKNVIATSVKINSNMGKLIDDNEQLCWLICVLKHVKLWFKINLKLSRIVIRVSVETVVNCNGIGLI